MTTEQLDDNLTMALKQMENDDECDTNLCGASYQAREMYMKISAT